MKRISFYAGGLVFLLSQFLLAAVPQLINFQGILKDGSGNPVANGSYSVVFTIYDMPTAGSALWTETQSVTTTNGLFTTLLGNVTPIPDTMFNDSSRYLGIKVGADPEMTPRQQMVSAPFALRVAHFISDSNTGNTVSGVNALASNTTGVYNTASGNGALQSNTTGIYNTASGSFALQLNTTGTSNTASGVNALQFNTTGFNNTASGIGALWFTTASANNTAVGYNAGASWDNGYNNVFVGVNTDVTGPDLFNVIAIGQGTRVGASSTARFGNPSTVSYGGWAGWTNVSDGRFKKNVRENVPGIEFIKKLRPITYNLDATGLDAFYHKNDNTESPLASPAKTVLERALREKEQIVYTGFVAQEVEAAARTLGFDFSGVDAAKDGNDVYGLRYAEFVVPLVKAVQELGEENERMKKELNGLRELLQGFLAKEGASTPVYTLKVVQKGGSK